VFEEKTFKPDHPGLLLIYHIAAYNIIAQRYPPPLKRAKILQYCLIFLGKKDTVPYRLTKLSGDIIDEKGEMPMRYSCPYLQGEVELTEERENHISERHPELIPEYRWCIAETLSNPDTVRRSTRFGNARMFCRWFDNVRKGKYVVIVVVSDDAPEGRHWVITAYITRNISGGVIEWKKN